MNYELLVEVRPNKSFKYRYLYRVKLGGSYCRIGHQWGWSTLKELSKALKEYDIQLTESRHDNPRKLNTLGLLQTNIDVTEQYPEWLI